MSYPSPHSGWQSNPYEQSTPSYGYGAPGPLPPNGYGNSAPMPPNGCGYPPGPPKKRNTGVIIAVICGVVAIVIAFFVVIAPILFFDKMTSNVDELMSNSSGGNTEQILDDELDVDFGAFTRDRTYSSLTVGKLPVTVHNKGSERATYNIQIEAVDANGDRIAEDTVYVANLAPSQSVTKDVFTTNSDDYYELTEATFKVAGISKY
jgi:hypothetical protein